MKRGMKIGIVLATMVFLACAVLSPAFAAEGKKSCKQAAKDVGRAVVDYPANFVAETVDVVGTAAKDTAGVVVDTVKVTGQTVTGDVEKAPEIVATPVQESAETVKDAAVGIAETPVEAGKETARQIR